MTTVSSQRLAVIFVEVADTLVDEFDLLDFLHMLTGRVAGLIEDSSVGLMLADQRGRLEFVAGSNENVRMIELYQLQNNEGPCLEAFRSGEPVLNVDLTQSANRWPLFATRAMVAGFQVVHAFPLRLREEVIGALNVFQHHKPGRFDRTDAAIVQALADVAAIGLLQERAISRGEVLTGQLQNALNSRIVIEQAKGAVAQAMNVSVDEAFDTLRAYARRHSRRLTDVAHAVVTDFASLPELHRP
jgi:GAF domain-containing protein